MLEEHICHVQVGPNTSNFWLELPKSFSAYLRVFSLLAKNPQVLLGLTGFPRSWKIRDGGLETSLGLDLETG